MDEPILKKYKHNPSHLYMDDTYYFLTSATLYKKKIFLKKELRHLLIDIIKEMFAFYNYSLIGWVILYNHYHLLFKSRTGNNIPELFRKIHSKSAVRINKSLNTSGRIWYNYWDECIRNEPSLYTHLNYIHLNPVKHAIVKQPQEYEFSSYHEYLKVKGEEWMVDLLRKFPVIDFMKGDYF